MTRLEVFTVFACLTILVSIDATQTRLNKPAWDASSAFRQRARSWLYWAVVTSQDVCSTSSALWAGSVTMLAVVQ
jgi:hypothetical protein